MNISHIQYGNNIISGQPESKHDSKRTDAVVV